MRITAKADYAVRAAAELAAVEDEGTPMKCARAVEHENLPLIAAEKTPFLRQEPLRERRIPQHIVAEMTGALEYRRQLHEYPSQLRRSSGSTIFGAVDVLRITPDRHDIETLVYSK